MTTWLKKYKTLLFLVILCTIFFSFYSSFNLTVISQTNPKFSSPDETGNYFWIERFAVNKPLYYFEELNGVGTNLLHLRGMNTIAGKVTPGSFIGMTVIYGSLARIFSPAVIPYLTPFFSVLGLMFFYLLINKLFNHKSIALISTVLLSFFPAWIYYSARGMYHNVLFLSLLIIGVYLLFKVLQNKSAINFEFQISNFEKNSKLKIKKLIIESKFKIQNSKFSLYFLSGFIIGLSVITRTAEMVWIFLTVLFIFIFNFKKIYWPGFVLFLSGVWIPILILLCYNQILYGAFISAGYKAIVPAGGLGEAIKSGVLFRILISPFGFDPKSILINAYNYLIKFIPYWSIPAIFGGLLFFALPKKILEINYKKRLIYLIYLLLTTCYLLLFYGSWQFTDRIDNQTFSLGTSYLRYWLPIYILAMPFLATLIWQVVKLLTSFKLKYKNIYRPIISALLIFILFMPTINLVFRKTDESLFLLKNLSEPRIKSELINKKTNPEDVIAIYKQADKIFFPERNNIITELVVDADYQALANLAKIRTIYYYTFAKPDTVEFISRRYFEPHGLKIIQGQKILGTDWLYQIK